MATRTYAYGAKPPSDLVQRTWMLDELRRASRYKNNLVASHRAERERVAVARRDPQLSIDESWISGTLAHYREQRRMLRGSSGLAWGTYQLVEQDVDASLRSGGELRFKRFDGTGRVGAAIQACTKARTENAKACVIIPGERQRHRVVRLTIRRGVVVEMPIIFHRPLPPGRLLRAYVQIERVGTRYVWGLRVVVQEDQARVMRRGTGTCAVNFGWRVMNDGIRVAYAVGDHGTHELILPKSLIGAYRHAESLRSIADVAAGDYLGDARRRTRMRAACLALPAPMVPTTRTAPWANGRHWALQDRHLFEWESDERAKIIRRRRAIALEWVQQIASTYDHVVVETYRLSTLINRDRPVEIPEARHVRFIVAPGELRSKLLAEMGPERVTRLKSGEMTLPHLCADGGNGRLHDHERARSVTLVCERCSVEVDQDANNAKNQMVAAAE